MRSKEVDEAIKSCNLLLMGDITLHIIDDDCGTAYAGIVNKQYNDDLETLLNYISELEKKDKTYEIVEEKIELEDAEKELTMKSLKIIKEYMKDMKENHQYYSHAEEDAIKNLKLYINDSTPNQKIRDKIKELEDKAISYGLFIDKDESFSIESKMSVLKEIIGE